MAGPRKLSPQEVRPRYTPTTCFETFPFPRALAPFDTAHQRTETVDGGAVIPAGLSAGHSEQKVPLALVEPAQAATKTIAFVESIQTSRPHAVHEGRGVAEGSAKVKEEPAPRAGDTQQSPLPPLHPARSTNPTGAAHLQGTRQNAIAIATAAKRLNDLREAWLNPPEWTNRVPEVIPLGMDKSPYPDRILPKLGCEKLLAERTLTKLYNQRPAWLNSAHQALDKAVAAAYGWTDYTPDMPDEEILKRLLALNLSRCK